MTGSLQQKNGEYYAVINLTDVNGKRKQKWINTGFEVKGNKKKAEKFLRDRLKEFEAQENVLPCDILFADYVKEWLKEAKIKVDIVSFEHYEQNANNHIIPYFECRKTKLVDVSRQILQDYFNEKYENGNLKTGKGLSAKTLRHHKNIIHQTLELALINNLISNNPCKDITLPKLERNVYSFFNLEETKSFLNAVKNERLYPVYYITAVFGLRRSEVLGIKWDSIDFDCKKLTIQHTRIRSNKVIEKDKTKTKTSFRSFPLPDEIICIFKELKEEETFNKKICGKEYVLNDYVFKWENGMPYHPDYLTSRLKKDLKKYGFKDITFHGLRHSCGSMLNEQGFTLKDIQEWLGHADIQTTANIYLHLDIKRKENISNAITNSLKF